MSKELDTLMTMKANHIHDLEILKQGRVIDLETYERVVSELESQYDILKQVLEPISNDEVNEDIEWLNRNNVFYLDDDVEVREGLSNCINRITSYISQLESKVSLLNTMEMFKPPMEQKHRHKSITIDYDDYLIIMKASDEND